MIGQKTFTYQELVTKYWYAICIGTPEFASFFFLGTREKNNTRVCLNKYIEKLK